MIQFVVITKGATRISEVAARFMLDGLPGRQMAIDADLHAGLIDQHEAHRRREGVYRQADFFGAMDGAGKFVRGDAVAGLIITAVNITAGLFLGVFQHGMSVGEAVDVFTKLTIGDGLVSQVPAFLISLAAGLIVTRSSEPTDLGADVVGQLLGRPAVLGSAAAFLGLLALTPFAQAAALDVGRGARGRGVRAGDEAGRSVRRRRNRSTSPRPAAEPPSDRDGRPAPRRSVGVGDRLSPDWPGRPDPRRRPARPAPVGPASGSARPRLDRAAGPHPR